MHTPDTLPEWKAKTSIAVLSWNLGDREGIILNVRVWRPLEVIGPTFEPSSLNASYMLPFLAAGDHELELLKSGLTYPRTIATIYLYGCSTRRQDGLHRDGYRQYYCAVVFIVVNISVAVNWRHLDGPCYSPGPLRNI